MHKVILKAREADNTSRFYIAIASVDVKNDRRYEAILTIGDRKQPKSKYAASDVHITGRSKEIVYEQIREVATIFPPMKNVQVLDIEEMRKLYEE